MTRLVLDALETRRCPVTTILLDFNGYSQQDINYIQSRGISTTVTNTAPDDSFIRGFEVLNTQFGGFSTYQFLDFSGDGKLDATDGNMAASLIAEQVRTLFAPYDVRVVRQDSAIAAVDYLTGHATDDAFIFVTGNENPAGAGGVAPVDPNNTRDDIGASGGSVGMARWIVQSGWAGPAGRDAFINFLGGATAHEAGHTFGLQHVSEPGYTNRALMTASAGFEV
ncbi:MAG TPA: hypothetical protein VKD90_10500, partial [Gemmataceae bacterium]|nr:hypothetical protein [Gemmataceae bacterium]